jgi:hypothetical protein
VILLPLPSAKSIYQRFRIELTTLRHRLLAVDQIAGFLESRLNLTREIADDAVLAADTLSCSKMFISMMQVECADAGYLFAVYVQQRVRAEQKVT